MFMYKISLQILWNNEIKIDFLLLKKSLVIGSKEIFLTIKYIFCVWNSLLDCCIQRYDPYSKVFSKEYYDTEKMHSIRRNAIEKASQGKKYGVVLGTLGRQGSTKVLQVPVIYMYWLPISLNSKKKIINILILMNWYIIINFSGIAWENKGVW